MQRAISRTPRCLCRRQASNVPATETPPLSASRLYTPYKSPHALSPTGPLFVEPTKEDWEKDPQLAGLKYPRFEGELWRYSRHLRKGGYPWQDSYQKRQFGEPLHYDDQALWVFGPEVVPDVSAREIAAGQLAFFGFVGLVSFLVYASFTPSPLVPKEFPHDGLSAEMGSLDGISRAHAPGDGLYQYSMEEEDE